MTGDELSFLDHRENVISAWRKIQGSPDLLDGLTFGEYEELLVGTIALMAETGLNRAMPLGMVKRLGEMKTSNQMIEFGRELLSLPAIQGALDLLSGIGDDR